MNVKSKMFKTRENPITTEIIRNLLISIADEMNNSLTRSAYSPIIYEMKDCSVCLFNKDMELIGQSAGLPIFMGNLDECIRATTESIGGEKNYKEGDIYILNDSYITGTHLGDVTVISPIFFENKLVGFTATRAHWNGMNTRNMMNSTDIYDEGLRIPPTKIFDAGSPVENVMNLVFTNCRLKKMTIGDFNAQVTACRIGEKRFKEVIQKYGLNTINNCVQDIFDQSEKIDKETVRNIPDGEYTAKGYLDNDGIKKDKVLVNVKVIVKGEQITIDLSGSSEQRGGPINCGRTQTISACRVAFKDIMSPDTSINHGNFRTMETIIPDRSIFSAEEPAPCGWYFTPLGLLIDLIIKALSPVLKNRTAAAHYGDSMVITLEKFDQDKNHLYYNVDATAGGWGAHILGDGESGLINHVNGDFKNMPIEVFETNMPLRINKYELRKDSGGAGYNRGGLGVIREYEALTDDINLYLWFERSETPAWGLFDGHSGAGPEVTIKSKNNKETSHLKVNKKLLKLGDKVVVKTGGGGGFGNPQNRERSKIKSDIENGYISEEQAKHLYGY